MKRVGVLALQGAFAEHIDVLTGLGVEAAPVRLPADLEAVSALVIPGGESTTISKLMKEYGLHEHVGEMIEEGLPVFGTCAGLVLLAKRASELDDGPLGAMNIEVKRNAFGRQVDSFEVELDVPVLGSKPFRSVFIRAPKIEKAGNGVEVLARLEDGTMVAARERNLLATAFHPELAGDTRLHEYFLTLVNG